MELIILGKFAVWASSGKQKADKADLIDLDRAEDPEFGGGVWLWTGSAEVRFGGDDFPGPLTCEQQRAVRGSSFGCLNSAADPEVFRALLFLQLK